MKKNFFRSTLLALFAMASTAVMAQDVTVSITDVTIEAGGTATATMSFTGEGVKGFGFYVNAIAENKITFEGCEPIEDAFAGTASAKAGIIGMTKSVAKELASRGVTVNAIAPGFIATDMTASMPEKAREAAIAAIPMKKAGQVEDIANTALFLASDEAAYITGEVIKVDGGMAM